MKTIKTTFLLLIFIFFSCSNNDSEESINQNPEDFSITAIADTKGLGILIEWDAPIDPDGDTLTYDILVDSKLIAENIATPSHSFLASTKIP